MVEVSDEQFETFVKQGIDGIPKKYGRHIDNLAFVVEDEPSLAQRKELGLLGYQTLFGLYQGIPLTKRGTSYNLVLPDKITIFKKPILAVCKNVEEVRAQINETIWHEVAHYFGLDHDQMHDIKKRR